MASEKWVDCAGFRFDGTLGSEFVGSVSGLKDKQMQEPHLSGC